MNFKGYKILVLGAGISGVAVAEILQNNGADATLNDSKPIDKIKIDFSHLKNLGVKLIFGEQNEDLLNGTDCIVVSPGISINLPLIKNAKELGILVMSEIEVAYQLCKAPIIAVTGTNGKTTTTTLVGEMLETTGKEVVVGGNIGTALSKEVESVNSQGLVVAEISSFQLEGIIDFKPKVAAVLNLTPDHLDRHYTMQNYKFTKEAIFKNQTSEDYLVLNYDDPQIRDMSERASSQIMYFSRNTILDNGVYVNNGIITIAWNNQKYEVCPVTALKIKGGHNVENALAACGVAFLAGAQITDLANVISKFRGVEHRIEMVSAINGVEYYNDSKATNPESSIKALEAFDEEIILIAGGRDKNTNLDEFMNLIKKKAVHLIVLGEAKERFKEAAKKSGVSSIHSVESLNEAVTLAHSLAKPNQVVILSPACSSYDMFSNYEERGRVFKNLVLQLS
ncbi:UDP-N-acetylmuramoyl-L-alanine--D-glutamate ligase [Dendrosporobacter sp. 1207_IL3150]|uniref:UDP-N-acetylmuramoyl-L-alanine--D-glutamate ligase n=1 Tax=Dendrosporobacter sp. 1207_IL3150 TaxID=3084054 RepID=UPI002FDA18F5